MRAVIVVALILIAGCAGTAFKWSDVHALRPGMTFDEVCAQIGGAPQQITYKEDKSFVAGWGYGDLFGSARAVNLRFDNQSRYVGVAGTWTPYGSDGANALQRKTSADFMAVHREAEATPTVASP